MISARRERVKEEKRKLVETNAAACDAVGVSANVAGAFGDEYGIMMYDVMVKAAHSAGVPVVDIGAGS
jgi:hypothetical protein